jgi:plastocyanin
MRSFLSAAALAASILGVSACGGSGGGALPPAAPSPPPPADAIRIEIVGEKGTMSFSPNPATVPPGRVVVWHNADTETHRVVFDDGEVDTRDIAPGAFSAPTALAGPGPYHCSIHPPMVGAVASP